MGFSPWGHQESGTVEVTARAHTQDLVEGLLRCTLRIGGGWPGSQPPRLSCLEHLPHHCSHQEDGEEKAQALRNKCRTPFQALRISGAYSQSMLQRRAVARKPASLRVPCGWRDQLWPSAHPLCEARVVWLLASDGSKAPRKGQSRMPVEVLEGTCPHWEILDKP